MIINFHFESSLHVARHLCNSLMNMEISSKKEKANGTSLLCTPISASPSPSSCAKPAFSNYPRVIWHFIWQVNWGIKKRESGDWRYFREAPVWCTDLLCFWRRGRAAEKTRLWSCFLKSIIPVKPLLQQGWSARLASFQLRIQ